MGSTAGVKFVVVVKFQYVIIGSTKSELSNSISNSNWKCEDENKRNALAVHTFVIGSTLV